VKEAFPALVSVLAAAERLAAKLKKERIGEPPGASASNATPRP
jgi:hypothetical protein